MDEETVYLFVITPRHFVVPLRIGVGVDTSSLSEYRTIGEESFCIRRFISLRIGGRLSIPSSCTSFYGYQILPFIQTIFMVSILLSGNVRHSITSLLFSVSTKRCRKALPLWRFDYCISLSQR